MNDRPPLSEKLALKPGLTLQQFSQTFLLFSGSLLFSCLNAIPPTQAQIIPDATLPVNSTVTPQGNINQIDGGTQAGGNLFHSFQEFSLPTGSEAFFNNSLDIQNIFSRVTGNSISNIDGLIRTNGFANLFLLNPNGIVFGPNAQLNIGGSFLASTADSIQFADRSQFTATEVQSTSLLTLSVPIGLQFNGSNGQIINRSAAVVLDPTTGFPLPVGLQVQPGKTIGLLGNDILLENGFITSPAGRIELGSVSNGFVSLAPSFTGFALGYQNSSTYGDIQLSGESNVNASGPRGGDIQVQGRRISLTDTAQIASFTLGSLPGGTLTINASDSVELSGQGGVEQTLFELINGTYNFSDRKNGLYTPTLGSGSGGDIAIDTRSLVARNGAFILTSTLGDASGGNVKINATERVDLNDSVLLTGSRISGRAGDITLNTNQLLLEQALIATSSFGAGGSGNLRIDASLVDLSGKGIFSLVPNLNIPSVRIASGLNTSGVFQGDAGNLTLNADRLIVRDGAGIGATTAGTGSGGTVMVNVTDSVELRGFETGLSVATGSSGPGGDLRINTQRLRIENGGGIDASTFGSGTGGSLTINASEVIEIIGNNNPFIPNNGGLGTRSLANGDAGNLRIQTERLIVQDGALIAVNAQQLGDAGNVEIDADVIELDNQGLITGETTAGQGNITLRSQSLILRGGSSITTNASGREITGGNITIDTDVIVALENSDISANSLNFRGGEVRINTSAIFGAQLRTPEELQRLLNTDVPTRLNPRQLLSSDITATGADSSLTGTIAINTPEIDPSAGLVELSENIIDATQLVISTCGKGQQQSEFIVTGRGGLPPNPIEAISDEATWLDLRPRIAGVLSGANPQTSSVADASNPVVSSPTPPLVEAQGWMVNAQGKMELVAQGSEVTLQNRTVAPSACLTN